MTDLMCGAFLPGGRVLDLRDVPLPRPGHAQVPLAMRASTICGSDLPALLIHRQGRRGKVALVMDP